MINRTGAAFALTIVGPGRAGGSIALAAGSAGIDVTVVRRRPDAASISGRCVLLCVPDSEITAAVGQIRAEKANPSMLGHVSGATTLESLAGAGASEGVFSMHPLQTIPDRRTDLAGAHAAVSGSTDESLSVATELAVALGMHPFRVREQDRAVYHASASIASNFLVALEQTAADLLEEIGVERSREVLAPLVRRTLENWIESGPEALTGPIARGDRVTVERHREALGEFAPDALGLYEALASHTASLAGSAEVPR